MTPGEVQKRVRLLCKKLTRMAQQPSLRVPDPSNAAYLGALHYVMDYLLLDGEFTIGAAEDD